MEKARARNNETRDAAVNATTGKAWNQRFAELETVGARKPSHAEIAGVLSDK